MFFVNTDQPIETLQIALSDGRTEQIQSVPKQQERMAKMAFCGDDRPMNISSSIELHQPNNQPKPDIFTNYLNKS
jgi:hypothetical protein